MGEKLNMGISETHHMWLVAPKYLNEIKSKSSIARDCGYMSKANELMMKTDMEYTSPNQKP